MVLNLLAVLALAVPAGAESLEDAHGRAAAVFEGRAVVPVAVPVGEVPEARPDPRRGFSEGFMDGFGAVETPAVEILDRNISCPRGLCEGSKAVEAAGYGLGFLLWVPAALAGLVVGAWAAVFG